MKKALSVFIAILISLIPAIALAIPVQVGGENPFPEDAELLELVFLDTFAAGDAFLLRCGGESMLIDSGHDPYFRHLVMHLENRSVTHINYFLNTHIHDDHLSGFRYLIVRGYGPDMMYLSTPLDARYDTQRILKEKLILHDIPNRLLVDGETLKVGGADVLVMRAQGDFGYNGRSTCNVISYGDARVLLMADATGEAQNELMDRYGQYMKADILKLAHHGYNRAVVGFLELVQPQLAVLTNSPEGGAVGVKQIDAKGIPYLSSTKGNVVALTDGTQWYVYQEKKELP